LAYFDFKTTCIFNLNFIESESSLHQKWNPACQTLTSGILFKMTRKYMTGNDVQFTV